LFSVDNPTLNRFYSAHYLLPFILAGLSILHLAALHQYGSTNPIGVNAQTDLIPFYPYYVLKDLVGLFVLAVFGGILVFFYPDILGFKLALKNLKIFNNYNDIICWNTF
jgi:ubiquinol-cytochrome c reductase cytochrome b subunit